MFSKTAINPLFIRLFVTPKGTEPMYLNNIKNYSNILLFKVF